MEYTAEQLAKFKSEFARRKRNQFILVAPVVLLMVSVILFEETLEQLFAGVPPGVLATVLGVVIIGLVGFSIRNWRCPACESYLGRSTSMNHCPKCGVPLK